jgi:hypothetical protein
MSFELPISFLFGTHAKHTDEKHEVNEDSNEHHDAGSKRLRSEIFFEGLEAVS